MAKGADSSGGGPKEGGGGLRPTVIAQPTGRKRRAETPKAGAAIIPANSRPASAPTAIPGTERKRIGAGDDDLKRLSPATGAAVRAKARRLLDGIVVETLTDRKAVLFGHDLQKGYSDLVSRTLELSQAAVLRRVGGYVSRMTDILGSIDLEALAGGGAAAGLGGYLRKMNRRIDSPEELAAARRELDQLVRLMGDALEDLLALKDELERQAGRIDAAAEDIEAAALAAQFLAGHLGQSRAAVAQRFIDRSLSLTQTLAQIHGNSTLREAQIEQPLRLIAAIQNVALVTMPGWLSSIASLGAMLESNRKPTQTEAGELAFQLRTIVQQLNA